MVHSARNAAASSTATATHGTTPQQTRDAAPSTPCRAPLLWVSLSWFLTSAPLLLPDKMPVIINLVTDGVPYTSTTGHLEQVRCHSKVIHSSAFLTFTWHHAQVLVMLSFPDRRVYIDDKADKVSLYRPLRVPARDEAGG